MKGIGKPSRRPFGRRGVTIALGAVLALAVVLLPPILDRPSPAAWSRSVADRSAAVSILSFNVLTGGAPAGEALGAIGAAAPDIVCLQELTPALAEAFVRRLGDAYPHRVFEPRPRTQGIGIASRRPLAGGTVLTLGLPYLPAVGAQVALTEGRVSIACVHLIPPHAGLERAGDPFRIYKKNRAIRIRQARALIEFLAAASGPAIVLGDFNELPGQDALKLFRTAEFRDACLGRRSRCGPTWPGAVVPLLPALFRIDHILGRGVTFSDAAVLDAGGSDHYPVAARFRPGR